MEVFQVFLRNCDTLIHVKKYRIIYNILIINMLNIFS